MSARLSLFLVFALILTILGMAAVDTAMDAATRPFEIINQH